MQTVQKALEFVHDLYGGKGDRLFTGPEIVGEISTSHLGTNMKEFCRLACMEFNVTAYDMRNTLISHTAQAETGGLTQAQLAMDHKAKRTTAGYALSSPFVRDEIYSRCQSIYQDRTKMLLENSLHMGGQGLHGEQGRRIERNLETAMRTSAGVISREDVAKEFLQETLRRKVFPLPVAPGRFCFKPLQARGECSKSTKDSLADVGDCRCGCPYEVQTANRLELVQYEITELLGSLTSSSELELEYWLRELADQLKAWPELEPQIRQALSARPDLLSRVLQEGAPS